jgi:pSer/pThr/pTyr-binding forkhead associated (FHA) protein
MDDRSLNGVFVNDERIEWAALRDGDELTLGCYRARILFPAARRARPRRRFRRRGLAIR